MTSPLYGASAVGVAIVTGGSRGVGGAIVRGLARRGYAVVVDYAHDQRSAESTVDVVRLFAETIEAFGGIDVVVHAVRSRVTAAPVAQVDLSDFDGLCRLNMRAALIVNREAARQLRRGGAIINLTSSVVGSPCATYGALEATGAAVAALTRVLALELQAREITVNAISLQVGRPCVPSGIADVVLSLLRDGDRLTGQVIPIDDPDRAESRT